MEYMFWIMYVLGLLSAVLAVSDGIRARRDWRRVLDDALQQGLPAGVALVTVSDFAFIQQGALVLSGAIGMRFVHRVLSFLVGSR